MLFSVEDTIVALSTPPGRAGLGVLRLSGPFAFAILARVFRSRSAVSLSQAPSHTLHHGWITDEAGRPVDEVVVGLMKRPHSYTGDDVAEISAHGSPVILDTVIRLCLKEGARLAQPGEFTFRAFVNGKMDLARAEAVADLIESRTGRAAGAALEQLKGSLSVRIEAWRTDLIDLLAHLEVALDYAEEDIRFITPQELSARLKELENGVQALLRSADRGRLLRDGLMVAIIGKPNAGKSSLLNALLERERAIVTEIAGTTRDTIEEAMDVRGIPVTVVDTAGVRQHTADPVEKIGLEKTRQAMRNAGLILFVLDAGTPLSDADRHIAGLLGAEGKTARTVVVLNKTDMPQAVDPAAALQLLPGARAVARVSALRRDGFAELEEAIAAAAGDGDRADESALVVTARHAGALERVREALREAARSTETQETEEIIALHLRDALHALGEITGETATDEILGVVFSRFCVGK